MRALSQGELVVALLNHRHCIYLDGIQEDHPMNVDSRSQLRHYCALYAIYTTLAKGSRPCTRNGRPTIRHLNERMVVDGMGKRCAQRRCFVHGEFPILPILTFDGTTFDGTIHMPVTLSLDRSAQSGSFSFFVN